MKASDSDIEYTADVTIFRNEVGDLSDAELNEIAELMTKWFTPKEFSHEEGENSVYFSGVADISDVEREDDAYSCVCDDAREYANLIEFNFGLNTKTEIVDYESWKIEDYFENKSEYEDDSYIDDWIDDHKSRN